MSGQANSVLQQEMPFDTVMRQSPLGMAVIAMDGTYVAVNDAYARIYGYLPTEMQGHSFLMVFPEDQRASLLRLHQNFLMYGGTLSGEWEVLRKDGTHSHVISESACVRGQDGTDRRLVYVTDISVRRKIESELEASRIFAHAVIDGLSSQLCVLNEDGIIVSANHAWRRFYIDNGGDPEHLLKPVSYLEICMAANGSQRRGQPDTSGFPEQLRRVLRGDLQSFELEYPWHTPTERRWFIARAYRLPGVSPARIVVSHDNVTALKMRRKNYMKRCALPAN
jgi:PAS domain S-box-containing protein